MLIFVPIVQMLHVSLGGETAHAILAGTQESSKLKNTLHRDYSARESTNQKMDM